MLAPHNGCTVRCMRSRIGLVALVFASAAAACSVTPYEDTLDIKQSLTTTVFASDGTILATWFAGENRLLVRDGELPQLVRDAVVAIEDERFWEHGGVDLRAVARALLKNVEAGGIVQGGSTITQQYVKSVILIPELTVDRKVEEAILALRIEESLTKEEILVRYLNTVYFGSGAYGIATAAVTYFDKDISELDLAEAALLAGLIQRPSGTDPWEHAEAATSRRNVVIDKMLELGWIDAQTADDARGRDLVLTDRTVLSQQALYPYFTEEVKRLLLDDPALGATATDRYDALFRGGLNIYTTIDPAIQQTAEAAIADVMDGEAPSAGLVSIDPRTGHVLAIVGGRDFYSTTDPSAQFNLATQGRRQPGSAFKPFVLAAALESGLTLDTIVRGGQSVSIETSSGPWFVSNYNDSVFPDLTVLEATVFSVNVIYARIMDEVGPGLVAEIAMAAGINQNLLPYHSLALGAQEVTVLDMASAYATFAAGGNHVEPIFVTRIENTAGTVIYSPTPVVSQALPRSVADTVTQALTEVVRRGTGQQARIGRVTAGKTGTSQNNADAWFVGYTPELVTSIWVGFPEGQVPLQAPLTPYTITGGTWPAQIWSRFASAALAGVPYGELPTPEDEGLVTVEVDLSTGFLAGPLCPRASVHRVRLPRDAAPTVICPIHNPQGITSVGATLLPDVVGFGLEQATPLLLDQGFDVRIKWIRVDNLATGTVFSMNPSAGSDAQTGTVVKLSVAGETPSNSVPSVLGFPVEEARARLFGFDVQVFLLAEEDPEAATRRSALVWKQSPAAATAETDMVTIWVNP